MTIRGTMDLEGSAGSEYSTQVSDKLGDKSCSGLGGYDDLTEGASVTITDKGGSTVAVTHLEQGIYIDGAGACIFGFQADVPDDEDFYGVTVTHRGTVQFTNSEMKHGADVTVGG